MKIVKKLFLITAGTLMMPILVFAAGDQRHGTRLGKPSVERPVPNHRNSHDNRHYYAPRHSYGYGYYGHKPQYGYRSRLYGSYSLYDRGERRHYGDSGDRNNCHLVSKRENKNGYSYRVGGTMCYDSYGQSYIVPGSRYRMR